MSSVADHGDNRTPVQSIPEDGVHRRPDDWKVLAARGMAASLIPTPAMEHPPVFASYCPHFTGDPGEDDYCGSCGEPITQGQDEDFDPCPMGCGRTTDDPYGGPCSACWDKAPEAE